MSQENVEIWRAQIEGLRAGASAPFDQEATISKMAEIWDPEIECRGAVGVGVTSVASRFARPA